jgi:error-prone DNA polymerase
MGWENPPVPWRELQRQLTWGTAENPKTQATNGVRLSRSSSASLSRPHGPPWAELHCHSSFSFLDGAATPGELVAEAARLGLETLALTDHDGMYGVPQFAQAAARLRDQGIKLKTVFGAELSLGATGNQDPDPQGNHLLILAKDAEGYRRLSAVISAAHLAGGQKGRPVYSTEALADAHQGHWVVLTGCRKGAVPAALATKGPEAAWRELGTLTEMFGHENVMWS